MNNVVNRAPDVGAKKINFLSLTEKGRWLLATLTLIFILGIGQMWGAGTAIADLNFNAPTSLPSNYTYSSDTPPTITTFQSVSCIINGSGGSTAPSTWSATNAAAPSGGKRWFAFQPAVDCRVTLKVGKENDSRIFYLMDKDHKSHSSPLSSFNPSAKNVWDESWSVSLTGGTWYAISGSGSKCYIASMQFVANPTFSESAGAELTQNEGTVTLTASGTTIYYKWSTSSNAYAANAGSALFAAADGSGNSPKAVTAPNGTGTYYLYAVAKSGNYYSDVVKRNYSIVAGGTPIQKYTVTLMPAGGSAASYEGWTYDNVNNKYTKEVSNGAELALPTFTKANRTFKTWRNAISTDITSPITVTKDTTLTAVWNATVETVIYSWEGAQGGAIETGGIAVGSESGLVNTLSEGYYCLRMNGNTSYDKYVEITLSGDEKVKTGDKITYMGFYSNSSDKNVAPKMRDGNDPYAEIFADSENLPKIYGGSGTPAQRTFTVPASINTNKVQLTRNKTGASTMMPKIQIIRPILVEEANLRTVTFNYNDGGATANKVVEVASGMKVSAETAPAYAHHRFHEWQLGGSAYDFSAAVTSNITLTADWTQLYTVTYAKGEESATGDAPTQDELAAGEKFNVAANTFTYAGHDFSTWNDGSKDVAPNTEYTMGAANVTLTAQWITATTKATVTYKDGETTLGTEEVTIGNAPTAATYTDLQKKNLATFDGWYSDPDLAEAHKIADMTAVTISAATTFYGKWNYQYASSINIEQWILTNGAGKGATTKTSALINQLGTNHFASNLEWVNENLELDSLSTKDGRNEPYLGLKVKVGGKMLDFRLANGQKVKIKFGAIKSTLPQVKINGVGNYEDMEITEKVWSYTAAGNDYISIKMADANAVVFKQIMIGTDPAIETVTLPLRVTYNANGGTCAEESAVWSSSALTLPDVTPAEPADYTFAGWYNGETRVGGAGDSYTPTEELTLQAHFAPVEYTINYNEGEHGETAIVVAKAGWGTEYTAIANPFTPETGWVFSGWAVTGVDGVYTLADGGSFTMPKNAVTLTALWDDASKVVKIVETNVKYESFADAYDAASAGQTIQLIQNVEMSAMFSITKNLTVDLNGKVWSHTNSSAKLIEVVEGATLTITGTTTGSEFVGRINLGKAGNSNGSLVIDGGYYHCGNAQTVLHINGECMSSNVTIDDATFVSPTDNAIQLNGKGTFNLTNSSFTGATGIYIKAGTLNITNCTVTGTMAPADYSYYGNGAHATGDGVVVDACNYPGGAPTINIISGTFEGTKSAVGYYHPSGDPAVGGIKGGTFGTRVPNELCAAGWVPSAADPVTGKYSVEPKETVSIIKATTNNVVSGSIGGTIDQSFSGNANSRKLEKNAYFGVTLANSETFQENDVLIVNITAAADLGKFMVYADAARTQLVADQGIVYSKTTPSSTGEMSITLPAAANGKTSLYLSRENGDTQWNVTFSSIEVKRAMKPRLMAITINGRDGDIDETNKTVAVTIPYESVLTSLTVVPTIAWNEAAATNSIVVNDGSAWVESPNTNTYKLTDKDGDYTVYSITLTRDVLKHAVKFYDGETLLETLEVEDGTSIATGDVPADPEKEDYIFQGWAESTTGDVVDVTSFTISAAKNFYAKWVADGAIKLINKSTGAINTTNFITGVTATEANSEKAAAWGGTQGTSISGVNALGKIVQYNANTNQTKIKIKVYNTNGSDKYVYIHRVVEGKTTEETVETLTATSNVVVESEYYEFNDTKNRSFYLTTNSTDVKILQVKVIDDGATPMKQVGEAGYSLNLNKGRVVYYGNSNVTFEGLALQSGSNYGVINSTEFQTVKNFSFTISSPVLLKVTTNSAKYYVSQNPNEDGTTATAVTAAGTAEFELTETTNPWYLVPSSTSNVKYTNIAFELPKAEEPVITTQPATNHTFDPGDMTATVVATVSEGTLHYQWYKKATVGDDEEVGTDAATLTTTVEGTYYAVVTNVLAGHQNVSVTSEEAELGYRVTNDATLMALSYGGTAITLEDGVYNYNVELAKGTTDVPALAATATMDGYADVDINDAAEFVNYEASSTVTVKSEDLTETNVYTVNFYVKHDLPQVDVTATTTWDMTNVSANAINLADMDPSQQNVRLLLANIEGVNNNASFNSQALMFEGQRIGSTANNVKYVSGQYVQFNVTVPGMVSVTFASNGSSQRTIQINGKVCSRTTNDGTYITYNVAVEPGSVEIEDVQGYVRISRIEFKAEDNYHRAVNPSYLGTLCWTNNAILGGATLYEFQGKNENNYLVFDEVAENRLEAGKPYIFMPENGNTEIKLYNTDDAQPLTEDQDPVNHMYGTIEGKTLVQGQDDNMYYFSASHIWAVKDFNVNIYVPAYYCYVDYVAVLNDNPAPAAAPGRRRVTMGVQGEQVVTGVENLNASEQPVKLLINGQIFILRGEKMFDATGRLVK